jgi:hypothetical protein
MANVQKEIGQLEHWLLSTTANTPFPSPVLTAVSVSETENQGLSQITTLLEKLSKQYEVQQHTLNYLMDRFTIMEQTREVHIQKAEPWMDASDAFVEIDSDLSEPIYMVNKDDEEVPKEVVVVQDVPKEVVVVQEVPKEVVVVQEVPKEVVVVQDVPKEVVVVQEVPKEVVVVQDVPKEVVVVQDVPKEVVVVQKVPKEVVVVQEVPKEVVVVQEDSEEVEEEVEEEEEEEEEELEEIAYKGIRYYKNSENLVYLVEEDDQPSETAVGFWKEKTGTIAFITKGKK